MQETNRCVNCGAGNPPANRFCGTCGAALPTPLGRATSGLAAEAPAGPPLQGTDQLQVWLAEQEAMAPRATREPTAPQPGSQATTPPSPLAGLPSWLTDPDMDEPSQPRVGGAATMQPGRAQPPSAPA